ncbi:alpha-N-acetylglucosaminidase [Halosquirtibacter laminarini]|uniref:alpha-N-acetylglucosaminidase n=1 Tax=Halosquirtibacter laminarini TaxID=3374600 RepID=UPI00374A8639
MTNTNYTEVKKIFGDGLYFSGDSFHELFGRVDNIDLPNSGVSLISEMKRHEPNAKWVFQAWSGNPRDKMIEKVDPEDIIILDLDCDNRPQYRSRNGWNNYPWIWTFINNFGGNEGMFGRLDVIANEVQKVKQQPRIAKNIQGVGFNPEAIENNSIISDLLYDLRWEDIDSTQLTTWVNKYASARYGVNYAPLQEAWQTLRHTSYGQKLRKNESQQGTTESVLCARPHLNIRSTSSWGTNKRYYDGIELIKPWRQFMEAIPVVGESKAFDYDIVNLPKQVLDDYAQSLYDDLKVAVKENNKHRLQEVETLYMMLFDDLDKLLNTQRHFMIGPWIASARSMETNEQEKELFEYQSRTLLTTWSFQDSNLKDYSFREWRGMMKDFYKPRWIAFFQSLETREKIGYYKMEDA